MKAGIIADDLTGANDTGVQFARNGLRTYVSMSGEEPTRSDIDVLVVDTDSRALSSKEAYLKVKQASELMKKIRPELIYKKLDSTLRGNVGAELEAVYDSFQPDFVIVAPGYPKNNRTVEDGILCIGGKPLAETEFSLDPKTPVKESSIAGLIRNETGKEVGSMTKQDLNGGKERVIKKMKEYHQKGIHILVFDSYTEEDLQLIVKYVRESAYQVIWSGSAGLANYMIDGVESKAAYDTRIGKAESPVLMVVGSVNQQSRRQLERVMMDPTVKGIKLYSHKVLERETAGREKERVLKAVAEAIDEKYHIVLYSSGNSEEVKLAQEAGATLGLTQSMVSERISETLGQLTAEIVDNHRIDRLFLSGGDTAKKACFAMGITEFKLLDEVEIGIPIGKLVHQKEIVMVTKAGGFGSASSLLESLTILRGDKEICAQ